MKGMIDRKSISSLRIARIGLGLGSSGEMFLSLVAGSFADKYVLANRFIPYVGFEWVGASPGPLYLIMAWVFIVSSWITAFGSARNWVAPFLCGFIKAYILISDASGYLNHHYLEALLFLIVALGSAASIDNKEIAERRTAFVIRVLFCGVYACAGIAKLKSSWVSGAVLKEHERWCSSRNGCFLPFPEMGAILVLLWQLAPPVLFWFKGKTIDRLRRFWILSGICFHIATAMVFNIGSFPLVCISHAPLFWGDARWENGKLRGISDFITRIALVIAVIACVVPFRYPGRDLTKTGDGLHFSWHMLSSTLGTQFFQISAIFNNGTAEIIDLSDYGFSKIQEDKARTHPASLLKVIKMVANDFSEDRPRILVRCYASLDGAPASLRYDETADIASQEDLLFLPYPWVK